MNEIFIRLNCSSTQEKLYLMLLETGATIASMLAKRAGVKRVTVYGALEGLIQKGLVETFKKNHVNYFQAVNPEFIKNLIDLQFEEEKRFMKRAYKAVQEMKTRGEKGNRKIIKVKNVLQYYEGQNAVKTLIRETLNLSSKVQYCIGLSGYHALQIGGEWKSYITRRVKKSMKVFSIQANTKEGRDYKKRDKQELRETRLIPENYCPEIGELNIIGDHIILYTSEDKETMGVKIVNKKIAQILKKVFDLAWSYSKELEDKSENKG